MTLAFRFLLVALLSASAAYASGMGVYRDKLLGDKAFGEGDYDFAVRCYQRYLQEAAADSQAWGDAARRLISSYLRKGDVPGAENVYTQLSGRFPDSPDVENRLALVEILVASHKFGEGEKELESLLRSTGEGEARLRALSLLGFIQESRQEWAAAAETFGQLESSGRDSSWEYTAFCRRVHALIMGGEFAEAGKLLTLNVKLVNSPGKVEARALSLLLLAREGRFDDFRQLYQKLREGIPGKPEPALMEVLTLAVNHYTGKKDYEAAEYFLNELFIFAVDAVARREALLRLADLYVDSGKGLSAIETCRKYLNFYGGAPDAAGVRMRLGGLLAAAGRSKEAAEAYLELLNNASYTMKSRVSAAEAAGRLMVQAADYREAARMFEFVHANGEDKQTRAEGMLLLGKLYFKQELYERAALSFAEAGELYDGLRIECAYWAMRSCVELKEYERANALLTVIESGAKPGDGDDSPAAEAMYYRALILERSGKLPEAVEAYGAFTRRHQKSARAPEALMRAAGLAFSGRDFGKAAQLYGDFIKLYPGNELASAALYGSIQALFCMNEVEKALSAARAMFKSHPGDKYTLSAGFWMVDYLRDGGNFTAALDTLKEMERMAGKDAAATGRIRLDMAYVLFKSGDGAGAEKLLESLVAEEGRGEALLLQAYYMLGDARSERGDFAAALKAYQECLKHSPSGDYKLAVHGRIGDCLSSLYSLKLDATLLDGAIAAYQEALGKGRGALRCQTMFKLGKCYEQKRMTDKALESYKDLIYGYEVDLERGGRSAGKPVWVVKAAYAAVDLYLGADTPEGALAAIEIYRRLQALDLKAGEDYGKLIDKVKRKYRL